MTGAAATVCSNFNSSLERYRFYEDARVVLQDYGIRTAEYMSLSTTSLLKTTCKLLNYRYHLVVIAGMVYY